MGFTTVKIVFDIAAKELEKQVERHAAVYKSRPNDPDEFNVDIVAGRHCSALWSNDRACPDEFLLPIGHELADLWMDVRYLDGDSWQLSCFNGFRHELSHDVNPWPYNPEFKYDADEEKGIQYRIDKLCKLLPQFADAIRPYLLLWRFPKNFANPTLLTDRKGKAQPTDRSGYGNADQYYDFLSCFGLDLKKPVAQVKVLL